jgi:hypothetical protein
LTPNISGFFLGPGKPAHVKFPLRNSPEFFFRKITNKKFFQEAREFRNMLITQIYPEIGHYLSDCEMQTLAGNLGCTEQQLWNRISWKKGKGKGKGRAKGKGEGEEVEGKGKESSDEDSRKAVSGGVRNILKGKPTRYDGREYSAGFVKKVPRFTLFSYLLPLFASLFSLLSPPLPSSPLLSPPLPSSPSFSPPQVWRGLEGVVQDPEAIQCLAEANQTGSEELFKRLLGQDVATLTGR